MAELEQELGSGSEQGLEGAAQDQNQYLDGKFQQLMNCINPGGVKLEIVYSQVGDSSSRKYAFGIRITEERGEPIPISREELTFNDEDGQRVEDFVKYLKAKGMTVTKYNPQPDRVYAALQRLGGRGPVIDIDTTIRRINMVKLG